MTGEGRSLKPVDSARSPQGRKNSGEKVMLSIAVLPISDSKRLGGCQNSVDHFTFVRPSNIEALLGSQSSQGFLQLLGAGIHMEHDTLSGLAVQVFGTDNTRTKKCKS
jgi:hypothetical protein